MRASKRKQLLHDLCTRQRELNMEFGMIDAAKKAVTADIRVLVKKMKLTKVDTLVGDGWVLVRSKGNRPKLSKTLLLEKGVSMDIIDDCTEDNKYESYSVRAPEEPK